MGKYYIQCKAGAAGELPELQNQRRNIDRLAKSRKTPHLSLRAKRSNLVTSRLFRKLPRRSSPRNDCAGRLTKPSILETKKRVETIPLRRKCKTESDCERFYHFVVRYYTHDSFPEVFSWQSILNQRGRRPLLASSRRMGIEPYRLKPNRL